MPYGIPKEHGGESEKNIKWIESCVNSIMEKQGKSKEAAIAICKAQFIKMRQEESSQKILETGN